MACLDDFIENARLFIFETFCRIHQCISIRYSNSYIKYCIFFSDARMQSVMNVNAFTEECFVMYVS